MRIPFNEEDIGYVYNYLDYDFTEDGKMRKFLLGVFSLDKCVSNYNCVKMTYKEFKETYPIKTSLNRYRRLPYKRPKKKTND